MNKYLLAAALAIFMQAAFAQDDGPVAPTDNVKLEKADPKPVVRKNIKTPPDRISLDLLGTNWIHNIGNGFQAKWYSRGLNVYFMYDLRIKKSRVSFAPGIGFSTSNIYHNQIMVADSNGLHFDPKGHTFFDTAGYNKDKYLTNKISLNYIEIPIELRIRTNPDKLDQVWKFNIGFKAGIRVDAHTKYRFKENGVTKVYKEKRFADFNLFRIGPFIRIGYSSFNIYGFYSILGVFKSGRGPNANEFAVGISFNGL